VTIQGDFIGQIGDASTSNGTGNELRLTNGALINGLVARDGALVPVTGPDPLFNGAFERIVWL